MNKLLVAVAASMFSLSCASAQIKANPDVKFPLEVTEAAPAFLFPVNLSHLGSGGDPLLMGVTVTAGVANKFGKQVVSGQQLFDLVGNLSFELAETIQSKVNGGSWKMDGSAEKTADDLSKLMEAIISKLVALKLLDKPIHFKYIIAVHSHGAAGMGGVALDVESWGGIFDVDTKQIVSYLDGKNSYAPNTPEAVMAQLPMAYNGIISKLIAGKE
jgi:hypothetical protein